jgi:hypothetical protein
MKEKQVRFSFQTNAIDFAFEDGLTISTTCSFFDGDMLLVQTSSSDSTRDEKFLTMLDRRCEGHSFRWVAQRVVEVQRAHAFRMAMAKIKGAAKG